jgi:hypothetical protein
MRWRIDALLALLALLLPLACSKKEEPPEPAPSPPPTQTVGGCQNIDTDGTCSYMLLSLSVDAGAELRYEVGFTCVYDGGIAMSGERVRLAVPRDRAKTLEAHYAQHRGEACHCTIVRPPCAPMLGISVRVDPPPYARVEPP